MFKCKICIEKEQRIAELKDQIEYFKRLLNPPARIQKFELEADEIMNGGGLETQPTLADEEAERVENAKIQSEFDFIFSTNSERVEQN